MGHLNGQFNPPSPSMQSKARPLFPPFRYLFFPARCCVGGLGALLARGNAYRRVPFFAPIGANRTRGGLPAVPFVWSSFASARPDTNGQRTQNNRKKEKKKERKNMSARAWLLCHSRSTMQRFWPPRSGALCAYAEIRGALVGASSICVSACFGQAYYMKTPPGAQELGGLARACSQGFAHGAAFGIVAGSVWPVSVPLLSWWAWRWFDRLPDPDLGRRERGRTGRARPHGQPPCL